MKTKSIQIEPLSQRDKRWRNQRIGYSNKTIGEVGCVLTCYTMLLNYYADASYRPDEINNRMQQAGGYHKGNLWIWDKPDELYETKYIGEEVYSRKRIKQLTDSGIAPVVKSSNGPVYNHYFLALGDNKIADPYNGQIRSADVYRPLSFHIYNWDYKIEISEEYFSRLLHALREYNQTISWLRLGKEAEFEDIKKEIESETKNLDDYSTGELLIAVGRRLL